VALQGLYIEVDGNTAMLACADGAIHDHEVMRSSSKVGSWTYWFLVRWLTARVVGPKLRPGEV
jgi:hypothetical protein